MLKKEVIKWHKEVIGKQAKQHIHQTKRDLLKDPAKECLQVATYIMREEKTEAIEVKRKGYNYDTIWLERLFWIT